MSDNETLEVRADRVREAAAGCGDAKRVLQQLFPEAFEVERREVDLSKLRYMRGSELRPTGWSPYTSASLKAAGLPASPDNLFTVIISGPHPNRAFRLPEVPGYRWQIVRHHNMLLQDSLLMLVLQEEEVGK